MNAKTKAATRSITRNQGTTGESVLIDQEGARMALPITQAPKDKVRPDKMYCVNPACKVEITLLNKYGSFNGGYVCSQRCDDAVDPVSKMVRERNSQLPSCDSVFYRSLE